MVLLTRNEVRHAREMFPKVALVVVSNVRLETGPDGEPIAVGGDLRIVEPWDVLQMIPETSASDNTLL